MTDPKTIAEGLTEAQRAALVRHSPNMYYGNPNLGWGRSAHDEQSFAKAGRALMDKELIAWHPDRRDSRTRLTQLGAAVRAICRMNHQ